MKYDGILHIATGFSAKSKVWKNTKIKWAELVERLKTEHKTNETYKEFINASKAEQSKIKDVGGFVGGYLRQGRRSPSNVVHRQLLTLDIDFAHSDFWDDFCLQFDNAAVLHATHKHCDVSPRYRLIMPLSRECSPDEYVAIARKIAGTMGIDLFDNTTFETNRLMFWPSNPKDVDYYCEVQDGPWVDADKVLAEYIDWTDTSLWPMADRKFQEIYDAAKKQEDPESKKGVIGAFNRTYGVAEGIDTYLSEVYVPASNGRYTYLKGSTASGLVIYDDKFAYSHHGTDPCSGKLCNIFDLVRIHLFGHLDNEDAPAGTKSKSYAAMVDFCREDSLVKKTMASETLKDAKYDFLDEDEFEEEEADFQEENTEWVSELEIDRSGKYLSTASNISMIISNDSRLKNAFARNRFDNRCYVCKNMPWRRISEPEPIKNVDFAGVRNYIETIYGITGNLKIDDALTLEFEKKSFHPIKDYLRGLKWDGKPRIDTLLIDYFGVEDTIYAREAIRVTLVGAVARVERPGCKFDTVLTIVGPQGSMKSSFINRLGKQWYSDTFMTVQGKEGLEQIQGVWIIEMAELAGLRKAEVESIKHFISKQEDIFRAAYARTAETYKRQCVFIGTTNDENFLKDPTGNRRFLPIKVDVDNVTKNVFNDLTESEVDQIWAEAVELYKDGCSTILSEQAEWLAKKAQIGHSEIDDRRGLVEQYLDIKLPTQQIWDLKDLMGRRLYIENYDGEGVRQRDYVCVAEIWCECFNKNKEDMSRFSTRDINDIMKTMPDWEMGDSTKNFAIYGKQRFYVRKRAKKSE